jgi:hypothetical protein
VCSVVPGDLSCPGELKSSGDHVVSLSDADNQIGPALIRGIIFMKEAKLWLAARSCGGSCPSPSARSPSTGDLETVCPSATSVAVLIAEIDARQEE